MKVLALLALLPGVAFAAPTVEWDAYPIPDEIQGFKLHCGSAAGEYTQSSDIQDPNATSIPLSDVVTVDGEYYCALTSYNFRGESGHSNEVHFFLEGGSVFWVPVPSAPTGLRIERFN